MDRVDRATAQSAPSARGQNPTGNRGWGRGLNGVRCQASVAQCGDAEPSDAPRGRRNVEEIVAANPVAAIEVISHRGVSCVSRMRLPGQVVRVVTSNADGRLLGNRESKGILMSGCTSLRCSSSRFVKNG